MYQRFHSARAACLINKGSQVAEKMFGMLRQAQHERKILNPFKLLSVRPEVLEG